MNLGERQERERCYQEYHRAVLDAVEGYKEHVREQPHCGAAPLCLGPAVMTAFAAASVSDPGFPSLFAVVAVIELARQKKAGADLARRLDVQRDMMAAEITRGQERETKAEQEMDRLLGRIDELEHELAAARTEAPPD